MKILFVHKSVLGAFGEAAMHYYPTCLAKLGHEVMMVVPAGGSKELLVSNGVEVFEVEAGRSWLAGVKEVVTQKQPQIVHVFLYSGCGLLPLFLRRMLADTLYILDIRSPLLRTGILRLIHRIKNYFEPLLFDAIAAHGVESAWTQIGKRKNIHLLPPGVDFSIVPDPHYSESSLDSKGEPLRLVYVGSLDILRKIDVMLEAVLLATKYCEVSLDIYGDGSERESLKNYVSVSKLEKQIKFRGVVAREELFNQLPKYDCGLAYIPEGIYEMAPALKTLEYLACGIPVIASDTFGNRMFVRDGVNGYLAGSDKMAFSETIVKMAKEGRASNIRTKARESVKSYDWMTIVQERLLPLYGSLVLTENNK